MTSHYHYRLHVHSAHVSTNEKADSQANTAKCKSIINSAQKLCQTLCVFLFEVTGKDVTAQ